MNKHLKTAIQITLSLGLGVFLIWIVYRNFQEDDINEIVGSFKRADYFWIVLSVFVAVLSHVFRAYRWKFPLRKLGYDLDLMSSFTAVMVGYLFNLAFPRLGEVTRCAVLARNKKLPFEKLFGTVVAERLVDLVMLVLLIIATIILEFDVLNGLLSDLMKPISQKLNIWPIMLMIAFAAIAGGFFTWRFVQKSENNLALNIREKIQGLVEGLVSLRKMEDKAWFLIHTFLIWASYVVMFWVTFQVFPETSEVPLGGVLASFVLGGISLIAVQGGLGAYPAAIMAILVLYGIDDKLGYAFGWIVWTAQTIVILLVGFASMIALPLFSKK